MNKGLLEGTISRDMKLERETVWPTQKRVSKLFDMERSVITKHQLQNAGCCVGD
jgi:hypothetical protein